MLEMVSSSTVVCGGSVPAVVGEKRVKKSRPDAWKSAVRAHKSPLTQTDRRPLLGLHSVMQPAPLSPQQHTAALRLQ